jgi:hypothetical protein
MANIPVRRRAKKSALISATISLWASVIGRKASVASEPFQTFSLDTGNVARIKSALLDRFLACMKPASIT